MAASIADQGNRVFPPLADALDSFTREHGLGYFITGDLPKTAVCEWLARTQDLQLQSSQLIHLPFGARAALAFLDRHLVRPDDLIVVPTPAYGGLLRFGRAAGASTVYWPLSYLGEQLKFTDTKLATQLEGRQIVLALSQPNNPTGRVLPEKEIRRFLTLLEQYGTVRLVLADEVHGDLVHNARPSTVMGAIEDRPCVVLRSIGKTFNVAALGSSYIVSSSAIVSELREALNSEGFYEGSALGDLATYVAYSQGKAWVAELQTIFADHARLCTEALRPFAFLKPSPVEASFLLYVRCDLEKDAFARLRNVMLDHGIGVQWSDRFGEAAKFGFRINFSQSREDLARSLHALVEALRVFAARC